jgi:hypothetical protein
MMSAYSEGLFGRLACRRIAVGVSPRTQKIGQTLR